MIQKQPAHSKSEAWRWLGDKDCISADSFKREHCVEAGRSVVLVSRIFFATVGRRRWFGVEGEEARA